MFAKSLRWMLLTLMTSCLSGCVIGEVVIGGLSATSSYFSYKASQKTLYSADCATDMLVPDAGYQQRWTADEKRQLLAHVRFHQDHCEQP